mmetsp:Transcript_17618/g.49847  ORF Transcript_17618/g.49847 Transcript_17618/m.49847 type:complete len:460 (-) Transcript_17618:820-2199(-)
MYVCSAILLQIVLCACEYICTCPHRHAIDNAHAFASSFVDLFSRRILVSARCWCDVLPSCVAVFLEEEAARLEVEALLPRRIAAADEADQVQSVEHPNTALPASRSAVVPNLLQVPAVLAPILRYASHAFGIRLLVLLSSDESQRHEFVSWRDWLPRIERVAAMGEAPCQSESGGVRHVPFQHVRQPAASSHPTSGRICDLEAESVSAISVRIVVCCACEVSERDGSLVLSERSGADLGFPNADLEPTHAALAVPNLVELGHLLHLNLHCSKDGRGDVHSLLLRVIRRHRRQRHAVVERGSILGHGSVVFETNGALELFKIDESVIVLVQFLDEADEEHLVELETKPVKASSEVIVVKEAISVAIDRGKAIPRIHASGFQQRRDAASGNLVVQQMVLVGSDKHLRQCGCGWILLLATTVASNLHEEVVPALAFVLLQGAQKEADFSWLVIEHAVHESEA